MKYRIVKMGDATYQVQQREGYFRDWVMVRFFPGPSSFSCAEKAAQTLSLYLDRLVEEKKAASVVHVCWESK